MLVACFGAARAGSFSLTTFDIPGASTFSVGGINNSGTVVGSYFGQNGIEHGFERFADGTLITGIDAPGNPSSGGGTRLFAINSSGAIAGGFSSDGFHLDAFTLSSGVFVPVPLNGFNEVFLLGINDNGNLSGTATNVFGTGDEAFERTGITNDVFSFSGAFEAGGGPINNLGQMTGFAEFQGSPLLVFIRNADGTFASVSLPNHFPSGGGITGINDASVVVGFYIDDNTGQPRSFYGPLGTFTLFEVPGSRSLSTTIDGINNLGQMDGTYFDANGGEHGFIASIATPEPASCEMFGVGLAVFLVAAQVRARNLQ